MTRSIGKGNEYLLRDADVCGEGGEIGVGDEQEDAVVHRKLQLGRRHGCPERSPPARGRGRPPALCVCV
jgi:hypothetical protein